MLPLPFENFVPKILKDRLDTDPSGKALTDFIDDLFGTVRDEILELYWIKYPERSPSTFLETFGEWLAAGIRDTDSNRTKRTKIRYAVQGHRKRGLWDEDVKIRIDSITGFSAALYGETIEYSDDSIEMAYESSDPITYWSTESAYDGADAYLGTWEVGTMDETVIAGNICIDCHEGIHVSTLTAGQIAQIVEELEDDIAPAYMRIFLGYVDTYGAFQTYSGGIIE